MPPAEGDRRSSEGRVDVDDGIEKMTIKNLRKSKKKKVSTCLIAVG